MAYTNDRMGTKMGFRFGSFTGSYLLLRPTPVKMIREKMFDIPTCPTYVGTIGGYKGRSLDLFCPPIETIGIN